jgi:UDP-N-acetylglucosamine diphosphorylase / glucose-1-phosphate thymidylyltransferase / UDP-N-acetylgalactosamine diphosphorylase / glucosamine-1-phosphate N-acetyltransferase / galactosamine-1-phosphate N-acetyltransferase
MKAVILAAGASSRMWPLASSRHKAFYEVCGKPLLAHTMENLAANGVNEQIIVVTSRDFGLAKKIASGVSGVDAEIIESGSQEGMGAEMLKIADKLSGQFVVASGHAVNAGDNYAALKALGQCDAALCGRQVPDVSEYGEVTFDADSKVTSIEEKPQDAHAGFRIVSTYLLSAKFVSALKTADAGHYSFEAALSSLVAKGKVLCAKVEGYQPTLKYPWHLLSLKNFIMERTLPEGPLVAPGAEVDESAIIRGRVYVSKGAKVMENAVIKGPAYIGEGAVVGTGALVRNYSCLEANAVAGYCTEVKNSLVLEGAHLHHCSVEDSVIDRNARLAAFCVTANRRFDKGNVKSDSKNGKKDTGLDFFGTIMGEGAWLGVNASVMPGVKLGAGAGVMPNKVAYSDVKDGEKVE